MSASDQPVRALPDVLWTVGIEAVRSLPVVREELERRQRAAESDELLSEGRGKVNVRPQRHE